MLSTLIFDSDQNEQKLIKKMVSDTVAIQSDESCNFDICVSEMDLKEQTVSHEMLDIACMDIMTDKGIGPSEEVRKKYSDSEMMLIVSESISPRIYMKPSVRASSVIFRPLAVDEASETISEVVQASLIKKQTLNDSNCLVIQTKEDILHLPFAGIDYIEARMKKLYIRADKEEFACNDTLDCMQEELPDQFIRCHRGYIVNKNRIKHIDLANNVITLINGLQVPMSRSYKSAVKEYIR